MSWQPTQADLEERLEQLRFVPDFLAYLTYVLIHCVGEQDSHRAVAGLLLKNALVARSGPPQNEADGRALAYVKATILTGLQDKDQMIRQTVGAVITSLLSNDETGAWPEALDAVTNGMSSQDPNLVEGVFNTLDKICEDCPHKLDVWVGGQNLLDHIVPQLIKYTAHSTSRIRLYALECLVNLCEIRAPAISANIDSYIQALFARAGDESSDVRRVVCASLGHVLNHRPDKLVPELNNVVDYIAYCSKDQDELVALEASEFWLTFSEEQALRDQLRPFLPKITPLLLDGMVYSDYELATLDADEDDEAVPDRETDIKPRGYSAKTHGAHESNEASASSGPSGKSREAADRAFNEEEDDDDDDDDFVDDEDYGGEWNMRKCSAAALDVLAVSFGPELMDILLPYLKERLFSGEWVERESGILALGAIAEGCIDGLEPHLPQLVPWLLQSLKDSKALIRSITCWTLGRYSSWCVHAFRDDKTKVFIPTMEGRVQEAGCSAFATLEEEAGSEITPFLEPILRNLTNAFEKYQQKNLLILYDALGTLADAVGSALGQPLYLEILMPPLIQMWMKLGDDDEGLVPLLECLSSVAIAAGTAFSPYTVPVYQRCVQIINTRLQEYQKYESAPDDFDEPDRTYIVVALDLLSGLTQGLGEQIHQLVATSQPPLLHLMAVCLTHYEPPIRQSAHALLGDMAISCFPLLKPIMSQFLPTVTEQIIAEPPADCVSVCNNATWAVGEIAMQYASDSTELQPFVSALIQRLVPILLSKNSPKSLSENAAVTIGRLGLACPAVVAPELRTFAQEWCTALWEIKDNEEKDSAFRGFCMMVSINPSGIEHCFVFFCNAVCKWTNPSAQLNTMFQQILQGFKDGLGPNWEPTLAGFPPVLRDRMRERYGV
ncbi:hypothetical protein TREMEDRAFT_71251 [Tremella mesenterica DSM 1558]|uniref:uncharacterized protein n=1 Tax=Tremella mesenterica (strain ATCC 24925 / CBS 8224 / DSM 1558 / NBRC 9311 / NRRL Y-6157 / RJB 2259-6 / UBC 559-6) TaxID=578456 RepID=UPI0003F49B0A|nr:uncharacterized protein TREMEDRAFT_71251 [Tremella mesenterica DSM 1558]EIW71747.1 hypothetical protein TREMEDRAFT_71251 [Tremella mesenterica DSM 1558]